MKPHLSIRILVCFIWIFYVSILSKYLDQDPRPEGPAKLVQQTPSTREDFVADFVVFGWLRPRARPGESCVMHGMLVKLGISA